MVAAIGRQLARSDVLRMKRKKGRNGMKPWNHQLNNLCRAWGTDALVHLAHNEGHVGMPERMAALSEVELLICKANAREVHGLFKLREYLEAL